MVARATISGLDQLEPIGMVGYFQRKKVKANSAGRELASVVS